MRLNRFVPMALAGALLSATALAQFNGPTPLAWRWSWATSAAPSGAPIMSGNSVYVTAGNRIFGLDRRTGNQKWRFPLADPIPGNFRNGLAMADGTVIAAGDNKLVYAVDATTGQSKWQAVPPAPVIGQPVVVGKAVVFALSDNSLWALNVADGAPFWAAPFKVFDGLNAGITARGTDLYYITAANELISMNTVTQRTNWKRRFSLIGSDSVPTVFGESLFINSGSFVAALSAGSGNVRWQLDLGEQLAFSPAVSVDGVLTVSRDGNAFLLNTNTGQPLVRRAISLGSVPVVSPSAIDRAFIVPTTNGSLNLVKTNGEIGWSFLIRPLGKIVAGSSTSGGAAGGNSGDGGAGRGGGLGAGGLGGGSQQTERLVWSIPASGPAVLADGTLFVQAIDGSLLAFDGRDGVDLTGPAVQMLWPNPGDQVSGQPPLEFIFRVVDEGVGVNNATLKIQIDGQDAEYTYGRDGFAVVRISTLGKNKPLMDGRRNVVVTATDWLGNVTTKSFTLTIDNTLRPLARPGTVAPGAGAPGAGGGGGRGGAGGR